LIVLFDSTQVVTSMEGGASRQGRVAQACDACKRRKAHCNGEQRCQQCNHLNLRCIYTPTTRGRARKNTAERGTVIESYRRSTRSAHSPTSSISVPPAPTSPTILPAPVSLPPVLIHPNPSFFLNLVPDYLLCVYPVNPVISEVEIRACVHQMDTNQDAAPFVYAFAAVTINFTRTNLTQFAPDARDQISALLTRSFKLRTPMAFESQPVDLHMYHYAAPQIRLCSVAKLQIRSKPKVRQKRTRSFPIRYAFVAL
jgi:Fungal Zn(2)-Cys(6) binuclear cluster domain